MGFRRLPIVLVPFLFAACDLVGGGPEFAARDSAGVRIVEHASLAGLPVRSLAADTPEVRLGSAMGDPQEVLSGVNAGAVLPDGRIVLLDAGSSQVRFYTPRGQMNEAQGTEGEGPGEYVFPSRLFVTRGDSLVVWDDALGRASVLSPTGEHARDAAPDAQVASPRLAGVFGDGSLLIVNPTLDLAPGTSIQTQRGQDIRLTPDGHAVDTLGLYPGRTAQLMKDGEPVTEFGPQDMVEIREVPFSAETQRAVAADGYWVGTTQTRQIEYHDTTGALRTIVRWTGGPLEVTDLDKQAYLSERLTRARSDEERAALRSNGVAGFEFSPTLPTHGALLIDAAGDLWMSEFVKPETFDLVRWTVIGRDGVAKARVELPGYATPLWAGADRVLLRVTDELGVELVELWKLDPAK